MKQCQFLFFFPDLQFTVTSCHASVNAEAELRTQLQKLQEDSEFKANQIQDLKKNIEAYAGKAEELQEQLKWKELDFQNQLSSKDAKIEQLQKSLAVQSSVGKLQDEVKKLYAEREEEMVEKVSEVSRKARSPSIHSEQSMPRAADEESWNQYLRESASSVQGYRRSVSIEESGHGQVAPILKHPPNASTTRQKVFRHKLQKSLLKPQELPSSGYGPNSPSDTARRRHSTSSGNANGGSSLIVCSIDELPQNYKSAVATLPPIPANPSEVTLQQQQLQCRESKRRNSCHRRRKGSGSMGGGSRPGTNSSQRHELEFEIITGTASENGSTEEGSQAAVGNKALGESFA